MFEAQGLWWPDVPYWEGWPKAFVQSTDDMTLTMSLVKKFDVVVQAGGHCGEWPLWLARHFSAVYTFEPDALNFECLVRNVAGHSAIFPARGVLGDHGGPINLQRSLVASLGGEHHGIKGSAGPTPVYRIDDLDLCACDAIILDVEGMEFPALCGAAATIEEFSPVIHIENNETFSAYGWGDYKDIRAILEGYVEKGRVNLDVVLAKP